MVYLVDTFLKEKSGTEMQSALTMVAFSNLSIFQRFFVFVFIAAVVVLDILSQMLPSNVSLSVSIPSFESLFFFYLSDAS